MTLSDLKLITAIGTYGHTKSIKNGMISSDQFTLEHVEVSPIPMIFRRMVRDLEFDVSEMALSTYICARAHGKKFTGLPVFLTRDFYHDSIVIRRDSVIKRPKDLNGCKIGVRSYTFTPGVWIRGILQSVYELDLESVIWVITGDEHVAEYQAPPNVTYVDHDDLSDMLLSGEVDATIGAGVINSPDIIPLFPDAGASDVRWFAEFGIYPISHILVVKDELISMHPWLPKALYSLFEAAKANYIGSLPTTTSSIATDAAIQNKGRMVGGDPIPFGLNNSRKTLEAFVQFNLQQRIISDKVTPEDLFPANVV